MTSTFKAIFRNSVYIFTSIFLFTTLTACSHHKTGSKLDTSVTTTPDTYEKINRKVFAFNEGVDHLVLKPAAMAYKAVTPKFVDKSIGNFFSNLDDVGNAINNLLQFKVKDAITDTERFVFNSTFGLAGLVDIASATGLEKHNEDFGQTLAKWGVKSGPYLVLPFFGPSTIRDGGAKLTVDRVTDPAFYSDEGAPLFVLETLKKRSDLFSEEEFLKTLSDDKYIALRDIWLQNRTALIRDGEADEEAGSDLIDELESLDLE